MNRPDCLYIVIPCYNEECVLLPQACFLMNLTILMPAISSDSRIMFVNDGSSDSTWDIITDLSKKDEHFIGISQSRNRGHQSSVLAGLMEASQYADMTISIDCDGQMMIFMQWKIWLTLPRWL
ncbi:MAG: glycosyltransferase [Lachnospira eligens]